MSKTDPQAVSVTIMGKEYLIACPQDEQAELLSSAEYVDKKMCEIRDSGKVIGSDRIAVMVALNITHELLHQKGSLFSIDQEVEGKIRDIQAKIENALQVANS